MTNIRPQRWLDLEPGDSIIERIQPDLLDQIARRLLEDGVAAYRLEPQPQENGLVFTIVTREEMYLEPLDGA